MADTSRKIPDEVRKAHEFEKSNRAHASVYSDAFYKAPTGSGSKPPGSLLRLEPDTDTSLYTLPPGLSLSRFLYQSETSTGRHVPVSAFILWPYLARPHKFGDSVPVVAWAHGTSGITGETAPSNTKGLWQNFQGPFQIALRGYAVVATDYAGLGVTKDEQGVHIVHEYLLSFPRATDVLYSIKAAQSAFPNLSKEWVAAGHSQGGGAVWAVAECADKQDDESLLGTISISPVTQLESYGEGIADIVWMAISPAIQARDPKFKPESILNDLGMRIRDAFMELEGTTSVLFALNPDGPLLKPDWKNNPHVKEYSKMCQRGEHSIRAPMLVIHGEKDALLPLEHTDGACKATSAKSPKTCIEFHHFAGLSHVPILYGSQRIWLGWIDARFDKVELASGYRKEAHQPVQPLNTMQPEVNWYMASFAGSWQSPSYQTEEP